MIKPMVSRPRLFGRRSSGMCLRYCKALPKILPLLLAVLLVVLQTGAMLHALGHVSDAGRSDSPALPQHAACALCVAYAGVGGALPSAPPPVSFVAMRTPALPAPRTEVCLPVLALPYQVRAPPLPAVA